MDDENPALECEVCGGTDFHKESGHFYCNECQTQSQQVQEHVFDIEDGTSKRTATRKIQTDKSQKSEDMLTSWECFNYILKGLTEELVQLGAKPQLTEVVRCLWMKYLHKLEVFDVNSDRPPKVDILGSKKDLAILYNVKKHKRRRRSASTSTMGSIHRMRSSKKRALVKSQYEELSQSQNLTQDSSLMNDTLSGIKSASETSESVKIRYNRFSSAELKRVMSHEHRKQHKEDIEGLMTCHKPRHYRRNFKTAPTNLKCFTLYSILYTALLIMNDSIQLGDMLRFIREGHLSFGCYRHFFDEDISDKSLNLPPRKEKLFSHGFFRKRCAKVVQFLDATNYIHKPDLVSLCSRYCKELNLPQKVFECAEKLISKSAPKMPFNKRSKILPNYEGRAMSFILFALKLLFGLDGVTEQKLSVYANIFQDPKMFNFQEWQQFIGYRAAIMKRLHFPTALKQCCENVDSDMYMNYWKNQRIRFKGPYRQVHSEIKDYLQVLDQLVGDEKQHSSDIVVFEPSLTPFLDYTKLVLDNNLVQCPNILLKSFTSDSLEYLLRPESYLKLAGNPPIKNGCANDNIITEDLMYLYKSTILAQRKNRCTVAVKICNDISKDKFVEEYLEANKAQSPRSTNADVLLTNWQKENKQNFTINKDLLKAACERTKIEQTAELDSKVYQRHYNTFERYWMNIPTNPVAHYFPKQDMDVILAKFPYTFRMVLNECARIVEQDACDFYSEFLVSELNLVYFGNFGGKNTDKSRDLSEIRHSLNNCAEHW